MAASTRRVGNLPGDLTSFVSRPRELAEAARLLSDTRLLTLTGVGGSGKTRLALRLAADRRRAFPDGRWLVDLAPVHDGRLVAGTVAAALGVRDRSARPPMITLVGYLEDKRLLLVLDNCEHLLVDCADLADKLLRAAPYVRIVATSRQVLNIRGERSLSVPPMSTPDPDRPLPAEMICRYDAVRLFADRAAAAAPGFTITADNCTTVARLCHKLDGMPLAIELAAVRLGRVPVEEILDRLDDRLRLLTGGRRRALPRHQTLRAAIDWSHDLCSRAEQTLWARLSVFSGSCDLDAVEQVCSGDGIAREDILDLVAGLVDKSILARQEHGAIVRYQLLETIRQYGCERLAHSGKEQTLRRLHRDYYLDMSRRAEAQWFSPLQVQWLDRIRLELSNLRVALDFCMSQPGQTHAGLEIMNALYEYWMVNGILGEIRQRLDRALQRGGEWDTTRAKALCMSTEFAILQGDYSVALPLLAECNADAERLGDTLTRAHALNVQGMFATHKGDLQNAISQLEEARDLYRMGDEDLGDIFRNILFLAVAAVLLRDHRASTYSAQCHAMAKAAGAEWSIAWGSWIAGLDRWRHADMPGAITLIRDALRRQRPLNDVWSPAWGMEAMAWITTDAGQHEHAARLLGAATSLLQTMGVSLSGSRPFADAHEGCEAQLRRSLGEQAYTAAFQHGAGLSFDQAFASALGDDTDRPTPDEAPPRPLTRREREVAELIVKGLTDKEIAATLFIAQRTANGHVHRILAKLGFASRAQIAAGAADQTERRTPVGPDP